MFFQRIVFDGTGEKWKNNSVVPNGDGTTTTNLDEQDAERAMETELRESMFQLGVDYELDWMRRPKRVAILVSKLDHCLWEILLRYRADELKQCEIPVILSNHEKCRPIAETTFGIPFYVFPITNDTKEEQERKELELLRKYDIEVVVLARYMQVLSSTFISAFPFKIINIHHSFLPAFSGGNAYQQAHNRGVKLIGAT
jgi:formyltetrahydrofolate deformylase